MNTLSFVYDNVDVREDIADTHRPSCFSSSFAMCFFVSGFYSRANGFRFSSNLLYKNSSVRYCISMAVLNAGRFATRST